MQFTIFFLIIFNNLQYLPLISFRTHADISFNFFQLVLLVTMLGGYDVIVTNLTFMFAYLLTIFFPCFFLYVNCVQRKILHLISCFLLVICIDISTMTCLFFILCIYIVELNLRCSLHYCKYVSIN